VHDPTRKDHALKKAANNAMASTQASRFRAWRKTNESQVKNPRRHKKAGKESANHDSMAA